MPRRFQVVVDCRDPDRMAGFWAVALDYEVQAPPGEWSTWDDYQVRFPEAERVGFAAITDPVGDGRICFLAVPEEKRVKNRLHLDVSAPDGVDALVARLSSLGGTVLRVGRERGQYFVAMTDVEGNEFCVH
ncbi:VOC family protein [Allokutzneria sp. A3M-2-11 16]|uniref:VOC family protein n=1 Tax=Allokutzneria sp. A3M-2-11 16 TaxID=2962043 RepID=UPI0020B7E72D|nr:VOC family protein [Allokutzneria sp. A3M-2-11 16]MCP3802642.1 VOC family protein [Allokutzneria sp. A3M-2-11 16]